MKSGLETKWGFDGVIIDTNLYGARIMVVKEGEQTPYIYNKKQDKTFFVLQGIVHVVIEGRTKLLNEGDRQHIMPKVMHRLHAIKGDATVLEVGTKIDDDVVVVEKK